MNSKQPEVPNLNLLFVNTHLAWGGGELWTYQAAREFSRRGHTVRVIAARDGELERKLAAANLDSIPIPTSFREKFLSLRKIPSLLAAASPWIVIASSGGDVRLATRLKGSDPSTVLVYRRGLDKPIRNDFFHRQSMKRIDLIIASSEATRSTVVRSIPWWPEDRVEALYNPFDAERFLAYSPFDVRSNLGISPDSYVIGILGRLTEQKGHETVLRAMPLIAGEIPDTRLMIVGEGDRKERLERLAKELGVEHLCRFIGHADPVQPYYEACDVVAVPSYFEGFCFAALEAQILRKPVVASDTSSLPEVVRSGTTGYLLPPGDVEAFAKALSTLGKDEESRLSMGEAGHQFARESFSKDAIYDRMESLLTDAVGKKAMGKAGSLA